LNFITVHSSLHAAAKTIQRQLRGRNKLENFTDFHETSYDCHVTASHPPRSY
jgi:hypothetical protein